MKAPNTITTASRQTAAGIGGGVVTAVGVSTCDISPPGASGVNSRRSSRAWLIVGIPNDWFNPQFDYRGGMPMEPRSIDEVPARLRQWPTWLLGRVHGDAKRMIAPRLAERGLHLHHY